MKPVDWAVKVWNLLVPVGTGVELTNDLGKLEQTQTRSEAWVCCNQPMVQVEGRAGGYLLYRIRPKAASSERPVVCGSLPHSGPRRS